MYIAKIQIGKNLKKQYFGKSPRELVEQIKKSLLIGHEILEAIEKEFLTENFKSKSFKIDDITISCLVLDHESTKNESTFKLPPELEDVIKSKIMHNLIRDNLL